MEERLEHARSGERFEVLAGLAETVAEEPDAADRELAADPVVQRDAARDEVAARVGRGQRDAGLPRDGLHGLLLDERRLVLGLARLEGYRVVGEVAVAL